MHTVDIVLHTTNLRSFIRNEKLMCFFLDLGTGYGDMLLIYISSLGDWTTDL